MKRILLLLAVGLMCLLAACSAGAGQPAADAAEASEVPATPEPMMQIETSRGAISYPAFWEKELIVDRTEDENSATLVLSTELGGETYELFTVTIGQGEGERLGAVTAPDGTEQDVYIAIPPVPDLSGLSESEQDQFYGMQEGVNDVIAALND